MQGHKYESQHFKSCDVGVCLLGMLCLDPEQEISTGKAECVFTYDDEKQNIGRSKIFVHARIHHLLNIHMRGAQTETLYPRKRREKKKKRGANNSI